MRKLFTHLDVKYRRTDISHIDLSEVDIFVSPKHDLMGIVLDGELVLLNSRLMASIRMRFQNIEYLEPFFLLQRKNRFNREYVRSYLAENEDNPYALQNIMNCLAPGREVAGLTQFPPLNRRKTEAEHIEAVDRLMALAQLGDSLFVADRNSGVSRLIRKIDRCPFSHVGMIDSEGFLVELTISGIKRTHKQELYNPYLDLALYRLRDTQLTAEEKARLQAALDRDLKHQLPYGWFGVLLIYLRKRWRLPVPIVLSPSDLLYANRFDLIAYA